MSGHVGTAVTVAVLNSVITNRTTELVAEESGVNEQVCDVPVPVGVKTE